MTTHSSTPRPGKATGATSITHGLVQGIAQSAASGVAGVVHVRQTKTPLKQVRQWLHLGDDASIPVDPNGTQLTIDVAVEVEFGTPIPQLVEKIRRAVAKRVTEATGCEVEAVNVTVADIAQQISSAGTRARIR